MKTERRVDQVTEMLLDAAVNAIRGSGSIPAALEMLRLNISPETLTRGLCRVSDLRLRFAGEEFAAFKLDGFVLPTHKIGRRTMCEQRLQS